MIKLLTALPRQLYVACSGGVDSMAALDFLGRNHQVTAAFFDHGTETSRSAGEFVRNYCDDRGIPLVKGCITRDRQQHESWEEYWREQRYEFLQPLMPVITAHHLDDAVETWVWSSMHGEPRLPMIQRDHILRPFLATRKQELISWCQRHAVPWIEDASNLDYKHSRNYIRNVMMPHVLRVNPGIHKMVKKRLTAAAKTAIVTE